MKKIVVTIFYWLMLCTISWGQKITVQQYIDTYKDIAIAEMKRAGVPAAITLAQGVLETESGNSDLVKKSNNHFGIKCKAEWTGNTVYHDDDENGECFRKYDSSVHSYRDHSDFLRTRAHYAFLFSLNPADYKGWAYGLKKAGYATNPRYPQILIKTIEDYNLNQITIETLAQMPDYSQFKIEKNSSVSSSIADFTTNTTRKIEAIIESPSSAYKLPKKTYNGLKAVYADSGTSLLAIATQYDIALSNLLDYNDLIDDGLLNAPTWLYLERKLTEGKQNTYTVKGDETLYDIAQRNAIQLSSLMAFNGLNENDVLKKGDLLSLRSSVISSVADKKYKDKVEAGTKIHEVKPKENLFTIARLYKVPIADLRSWNKLESDQLTVGQKLVISK